MDFTSIEVIFVKTQTENSYLLSPPRCHTKREFFMAIFSNQTFSHFQSLSSPLISDFSLGKNKNQSSISPPLSLYWALHRSVSVSQAGPDFENTFKSCNWFKMASFRLIWNVKVFWTISLFASFCFFFLFYFVLFVPNSIYCISQLSSKTEFRSLNSLPINFSEARSWWKDF